MNILLDDSFRESLEIVESILTKACPEMMARKYQRANVQQCFVYDQVIRLTPFLGKILCVGSFEDTACAALKKDGFDVTDFDPQTHGIDLSEFCVKPGVRKSFDIVFSTSVLEHVENDEDFIADICSLLSNDGIAILTCDFRDDYLPGNPIPGEDKRFYTEYDMIERLNEVLIRNNCKIYGEIDYSGKPDFDYGIHKYSFATYMFQKQS